jgi:transposase InsO family protein
MLTLIDEFTRECLAMHIAWSIRAVDVITVIEGAIERYGTPEHIRSDNGPEFIAYAIQDWLQENRSRPSTLSRVHRGKMATLKASTTNFATNA